VNDLARVGVRVKDLWDLVNHLTPEPAIPILWEHLQRRYSDRTIEGLGRALAVRHCFLQERWTEMSVLYEHLPDGRGAIAPGDPVGTMLPFNAKFGVSLPLSVNFEPIHLGRLVDLALNKSNGISRVNFVTALKRYKRRLSADVIDQLESDADLRFA
jgi:hypothetical protein